MTQYQMEELTTVVVNAIKVAFPSHDHRGRTCGECAWPAEEAWWLPNQGYSNESEAVQGGDPGDKPCPPRSFIKRCHTACPKFWPRG